MSFRINFACRAPPNRGISTKAVSPDTGTTNATFDAAGNLKTAKDARAVTATYTYDALNRISAVSYTGTSVTAQSLGFQYDQGQHGLGRLTGFTDPSGSTSLAYSAQGRLLTKRQTTNAPSGVTAGPAPVRNFTYDARGRMSQATRSGSTTAYAHNARSERVRRKGAGVA